MAQRLAILGQRHLESGVLTGVYTVPTGHTTAISSVVFCNHNVTGSAREVRLSIAQTGEADNIKQYLFYDHKVPIRDSVVFHVGLTMSGTDILRARSDNTGISVNVFGIENF